MKYQKKLKILAIESSCDETAAAVIGEINGGPIILSNIISSQVDLHAQTGGVVPEVASRAHMEAIMPVITEALLLAEGSELSVEGLGEDTPNPESPALNYQKAISLLDDITHIAVTSGPGLIGSLLVGCNAAKTLAYARNLPIIPINHIEGHIYSVFAKNGLGFRAQSLEKSTLNSQLSTLNLPKFPVLALTVSGGHTSLTLMKDHGSYEQLGQTIDDAVGEAYDKVAKLLGLGYPGGPIISKLADDFRVKSLEGRENKNTHLSTINSQPITFPRPIINDGTLNFSFSGLKTAVLQKVIEFKKGMAAQGSELELSNEQKTEIAYAFEEAVADVLVRKTLSAVKKFEPKAVIFAGGVSANNYLKLKLSTMLATYNLPLIAPKGEMTGDNAAMIGVAAFFHIQRNNTGKWSEVEVNSSAELVK